MKCTMCTRNVEAEGFRRCERCRTRQRIALKALRRQPGRCKRCAKKLVDLTYKNCETCRTAKGRRNKRFRVKHPEHQSKQYNKFRAVWLKRRYGLEYGEYEARMDLQDHRCEICGTSQPKRHLSVDHNHESGKVRALLCQRCNTAIGLLRDDPAVIRAAADYVEYYDEILQ